MLLVTRIRDDNLDAFEMLYHRYKKKIFYFSLRYLKDREEAEDLVQQIFINIWEHRKSLENALSIKSYIYKSTVNRIYNILKKRAIRTRYAEYELQKPDQHANQTIDQIFFHDLEKTIDEIVITLPSRQQKIFHLSRFEKFSHEEIAKKLDISIRTVENQIYRAIKIIRAGLREKYY